MSYKANRQAVGSPTKTPFFRALVISTALGAVVISCATREDVQKVEERVISLERRENQMRQSLARLDSLARAESSSKTGDYAQLSALIQELSDRIDQLSAGIVEVQERIAFLHSRKGSGTTGSSVGRDNKSAPPPANAGVDCDRIYDDSFIQFRSGEYQAANSGFKDYLEFCGKTKMADNAQYWISEIYYARKKYDSAAAEFNQLVSRYPKSEKAPTAYYKIGRCFEEIGKNSQAREYYQRVVDKYPSTPEAGLATDKLTELTGAARNRGG
ncbi:MAG: tol-pal system protein YbgF [Candidatus Zixiibacteriota bacterium]